MEEEVWTFPITGNPDEKIENHEICVVGVFGKGTWGHTSKGLVINKIADTSAFLPVWPDYVYDHSYDASRQIDFEACKSQLEGYYDKKNHILYLHLQTTLDAGKLADLCAMLGNNLTNHSESHEFWKSRDVDTIMALVYLFSVSHLMLLVHPVSTFDISYDRLFHHVNLMRTKMLPMVKDLLKECPVGRDWWLHGRPCPPRLLIIMMRCHLKNVGPRVESNPHDTSAGGMGKKKKLQLAPIKRLEYKLEDQVYTIFRNSRVLTNIAINNLFAVPLNQMYIHIMTEQFDEAKNDDDPIRSMLCMLNKSCETHRNPTVKLRAYKLLINKPTDWTDPDEKLEEGEEALLDVSTPKPKINTLFNFIKSHTDLVVEKKGFKDSGGRNPPPSHFEVPQLKNWVKVANKLYQLFFTQGMKHTDPTAKSSSKDKSVGNTIADIKKQMRPQIDPDTHFSETRCSKFVTLATGVYQGTLPSHYTSKVHANQLALALAAYDLHARGPACDKYRQRVQSECEAFWNDGRRLCEVRSLTGRHCVHRFHELPPDHKTPLQPDGNPPVMNHSSRSRSVATSSCGRVQSSRDDPFTLKEANCDFYFSLDGKAPPLVETDIVKFPVHIMEDDDDEAQPPERFHRELEIASLVENMNELGFDDDLGVSSAEIKDGDDSEKVVDVDDDDDDGSSQDISICDDDEEEEQIKLSQSPILKQGNSLSDYNFSLSQHSHDDDEDCNVVVDDGDDDAFGSIPFTEVEEDDEIPQQVYTDGMMNSQIADGVLPLYPSWSLVRIAHFSAYSPAHGLEMPGFISGANYLIPWDITPVKEESPVASWPVPGEARKLSLKETKLAQKEPCRAYIGYEYETLRGQRFICSAPDKIVKVSANGSIRDSVHSLLENDMPLYTQSPIPARGGKFLYGQLMRVIIVTPSDQSVQITIKPRVIPGPAPAPVFYPSTQEIQLRHNSMWVLRLPYVYASDSGPHIQPKDPTQLSTYRVMRMITMEVNHKPAVQQQLSSPFATNSLD